jgi:tetratricopeptide (TPR) repeat protein
VRPWDPDTNAKLYSVRSLIDPPSTRPTDDFADGLNSAVYALVITPGESPEKYTRALDVVQRSVAIAATPSNLNTLGAAQFRTGDYKGALESLARSEATDFVVQDNHASNLVFSAMAQQKLGQHDKARALLRKVIDLAKEPNALDEDEKQIFDEAAAMIDPASTQPATKPTTQPAIIAPAEERLLPAGNSPHSSGTGAATSITFVNRTAGLASVYWIDPKGQRIQYAGLAPAERDTMRTYVNSAWIVVDADGKTLGVFDATREPGVAIITGHVQRIVDEAAGMIDPASTEPATKPTTQPISAP